MPILSADGTIENYCDQCNCDLNDSSAMLCKACFAKTAIPKIKADARHYGWCNRTLGHMIESARSRNKRGPIAIAAMILKSFIANEGRITGGGYRDRNFLADHAKKVL